ncbi:uncharacterized protein LOC142318945 [Lycorma delicatula]|uniref:uncharacterized protein LOC142318945 n=1 Tax=Lycorma delicatula TaxID=130591 RepID=UPI003F515B72
MNNTDNSYDGNIRCSLLLSPCLPVHNYVVDITSDGKLLGIGCNKSIGIYNIALDKVHSFCCGLSIKKIVFSPNGELLACTLYENNIIRVLVFDIIQFKLWMTVDGDSDFTSIEYSSLFWSPKSTFLWFTWNASFYSGIFEIMNKNQYLFNGIKVDVLKQPLCSFSPDEEYYIAAQRTLPSSIRIYSTENFICLKTYSCENMQDINYIGWFFDSASFYVVESAVKLDFQVWSLDGRLQHKLDSNLLEYGIRQTALSPCSRLVAIMQMRKTEVLLYDTLTWKKSAALQHSKSNFKRKGKIIILDKLHGVYSKHTSHSYNWYSYKNEFGNLNTGKCSQISKNKIEKVFSKQHYMGFSSCGQYLATYDPYFPHCIWIWTLYAQEVLCAIIKLISDDLGKNLFPDIQWHPTKAYLAVDMGTYVIIWNQKTQTTFLINHNSGTTIKSKWSNTENLLISIYTYNDLCLAVEISKS